MDRFVAVQEMFFRLFRGPRRHLALIGKLAAPPILLLEVDHQEGDLEPMDVPYDVRPGADGSNPLPPEPRPEVELSICTLSNVIHLSGISIAVGDEDGLLMLITR